MIVDDYCRIVAEARGEDEASQRSALQKDQPDRWNLEGDSPIGRGSV
jgi:hypothetical protein